MIWNKGKKMEPEQGELTEVAPVDSTSKMAEIVECTLPLQQMQAQQNAMYIHHVQRFNKQVTEVLYTVATTEAVRAEVQGKQRGMLQTLKELGTIQPALADAIPVLLDAYAGLKYGDAEEPPPLYQFVQLNQQYLEAADRALQLQIATADAEAYLLQLQAEGLQTAESYAEKYALLSELEGQLPKLEQDVEHLEKQIRHKKQDLTELSKRQADYKQELAEEAERNTAAIRAEHEQTLKQLRETLQQELVEERAGVAALKVALEEERAALEVEKAEQEVARTLFEGQCEQTRVEAQAKIERIQAELSDVEELRANIASQYNEEIRNAILVDLQEEKFALVKEIQRLRVVTEE